MTASSQERRPFASVQRREQEDQEAMKSLKVFSGRANPELARKVCEYLDQPLGRALMGDFADGEISCKIDEDVRGEDVFIIQPTCPPVNDNLMELLVMIDSFRRASAQRITAVVPYFGYARQDRKDEGRVPISAKLVANLIDRAGANRVLTMDLHAAQIQGFFDIPVDHLYAAPVIDGYFKQMHLDPKQLAIVSPDEGSIKRALAHMAHLGGELTIIDKRRRGNDTKAAHLIGAPVEGKTALIFDDMISTGTSICNAAQAIHEHGAREVYLAATHGVLCGSAVECLRNAPIKQVVLTDTIPLGKEEQEQIGKLTVRSVAPLLGEAIKRIHLNRSVSQLFEELPES